MKVYVKGDLERFELELCQLLDRYEVDLEVGTAYTHTGQDIELRVKTRDGKAMAVIISEVLK